MTASRSFAALAGKKKPNEADDEALVAAFKSPERVPADLEVLPEPTPASTSARHRRSHR